MSHWNGPSDCNPNKQTAGDAYVMWCVASLLFLFSFMICNKAKKKNSRRAQQLNKICLLSPKVVCWLSPRPWPLEIENYLLHIWFFNSLQQPFLLSTMSLLCCDKNVCKIVSRSPKFSFGLTSALFSRIKGGDITRTNVTLYSHHRDGGYH